MRVCRVVGTVVATAKHPSYHGLTLLVCQPTDDEGRDVGDTFIAVDHSQAGVGDWVLVNQEGGGARLVFGAPLEDKLPIRSVVVGIVDRVDTGA
ncbi:MAG: EutN/CcmL family microcompartment protein [Deltaproteobacteria bacterium]|nr:EutN/CcmL family microcompartment protein [Deltaproteobacteria bacterium]